MEASRVISRRSWPDRAAFTLVEVLVSMTVLSIIVIMLTSLLNSTLKIFSSTESDQERHRSGRALTDFIGRELRAALLPPEIKALDNQANLQLLINPTQLNANYSYADSIFWQAPLATDTTYGDVAEVGYFVKWIPNGSTSTPTLCRLFVNPSKPDPTGTGTPAPNPDFQIYTSLQSWLTTDLLDRLAPADNNNGASGKNGYVGLFAENVLGMWVQSYGIDGVELKPRQSGVPGVYDSRVGYSLQVGPSGSTEKRYLPALIKISIAQVDAKYAARLGPAMQQSIQMKVTSSVNAGKFYTQMQNSSAEPVGILLPGIRTYSTDVFLDNGR